MTFQEKYSELHSKYEKAGKELVKATEKLAEINGFGDMNDIVNYHSANRSYIYWGKQFQEILKYVNEGKIDLNIEFVSCEYMCGVIKNDQLTKGIKLKDFDTHEKWKYYHCAIGLTNTEEIEHDLKDTLYVFPVVNLSQGKECYIYLSNRLQNNPDEKFDINEVDFTKVIDESKPMFVKVILGVE